ESVSEQQVAAVGCDRRNPGVRFVEVGAMEGIKVGYSVQVRVGVRVELRVVVRAELRVEIRAELRVVVRAEPLVEVRIKVRTEAGGPGRLQVLSCAGHQERLRAPQGRGVAVIEEILVEK